MQQTDILGAMDLADNFYADGSFIHMDTDAPYFYPDPPATSRPDAMSQGISPMVTIGETAPRVKLEASPAPTMHQPQQRMNFYPGYHQQMFQMKLMQEEQAQQQQQKIVRQKAAPSRVPSHPQQAAIDSIFDSFKVSPNVGRSRGNGDILPHIARMKKEEEEMDDDERLLASEEGKKLSSKERRQLRNKVSARAFRSRRKGMRMRSVFSPDRC